MHTPFISGVVLAGGESRRMGQNKALLTTDKHSLLAQQIETLHQSVCTNVLVASGSHHYPGIDNQIADCVAAKGPIAGIMSVIRNTPCVDGWVFLPVDMPNIHAQHINLLIQAGVNKRHIIHFADEHFPLYIPYSGSLYDILLEQTLSGDWSLRYLLTQLPCIQLNALDERSRLNTNTPEQWQVYQNSLTLALDSEETAYAIM
ncbi:MAG: molybdenum cofactor guanylyltransferase [Glaciecola sp.]